MNDSLQSCDHPVRSVKVRVYNGNGSVVLVDTPGFHDYTTTEEILDDIYNWLRRKSVSFNNPKHK